MVSNELSEIPNAPWKINFPIALFFTALINGILEKAYPSSTTLIVMCVMPTAIMQFNSRIKNTVLKKTMSFLITAFIVFMVIGRLVSGVHWFTDIIGGALLSAGLVALYRYAISLNLKGLK